MARLKEWLLSPLFVFFSFSLFGRCASWAKLDYKTAFTGRLKEWLEFHLSFLFSLCASWTKPDYKTAFTGRLKEWLIFDLSNLFSSCASLTKPDYKTGFTGRLRGWLEFRLSFLFRGCALWTKPDYKTTFMGRLKWTVVGVWPLLCLQQLCLMDKTWLWLCFSTMNENNAQLPISMQESFWWWQCGIRYIIYIHSFHLYPNLQGSQHLSRDI